MWARMSEDPTILVISQGHPHQSNQIQTIVVWFVAVRNRLQTYWALTFGFQSQNSRFSDF